MTQTSESIKNIAVALGKAQSEMAPAIRDNFNPHFKSKYADLGAIWKVALPALFNNGLSVSQGTLHRDGMEFLETMIMHSSGEYIKYTTRMFLNKTDSQSMGSAITYSRRYALAAALMIPQEDDDGNLASLPDEVINNDYVFRHGKYAGMKISECQDIGYLRWAFENVKDIPESVRSMMLSRIQKQ